jgi:hypothetical protein
MEEYISPTSVLQHSSEEEEEEEEEGIQQESALPINAILPYCSLIFSFICKSLFISKVYKENYLN